MLFVGAAIIVIGLLVCLFALLCSESNANSKHTHPPKSSQLMRQYPNAESRTAKPGAKNQSHPQNKIESIFSSLRGWIVANEKWINASSTSIIAIFTIILAVGTIALFCATRNLVSDARNTAEKQLRAYVFATPQELLILLITELAIRYFIQNTGQTPAYKVRHGSKLEILPYPLPKDFVVSSPNELIGGNSLGESVPLNGEGYVNFAGNPAMLKQSGQRIYLVVLIRYLQRWTTNTPRECVFPSLILMPWLRL